MRGVMVSIDSVVVGLHDGEPVQQSALVTLQGRADVEPSCHERQTKVSQWPSTGQFL